MPEDKDTNSDIDNAKHNIQQPNACQNPWPFIQTKTELAIGGTDNTRNQRNERHVLKYIHPPGSAAIFRGRSLHGTF